MTTESDYEMDVPSVERRAARSADRARGGVRIYDRPAGAQRRGPVIIAVVLIALVAAVLAALFAAHVL